MRKITYLALGACLLIGGFVGLSMVEAKKGKARIVKVKAKQLPSPAALRRGTRLRAPSGVWTWFDIPGTRCGYGKTTGMAINPSPVVGTKTLLLMLQGGGACWKEKGLFGGCFGTPRSAFSLGGVGKRSLRSNWRMRRFRSNLLFRRRTKSNPLRNAHFALIPYCTGDVHAGLATVTFRKGRTIYFHGHNNMIEYLKRIVATYPKVKRVILGGVSAGGVGASLHWQRVQRAFGKKVRVDLLNDGGAPITPYTDRWDQWRTLWNLQFPKGCKTCSKGIDKIMAYYSRTMLKKGRRMAYLGHTHDRILRSFLGLGMFGNAYKIQLYKSLKLFDRRGQAQYYVLPGGSHVMLFRRGAARLRAKKGPTLESWIKDFLQGKSSWKSYRP